jgi:hypothetical protein
LPLLDPDTVAVLAEGVAGVAAVGAPAVLEPWAPPDGTGIRVDDGPDGLNPPPGHRR